MFTYHLRPCSYSIVLLLFLVAASEERYLLNHNLGSKKSRKIEYIKGKVQEHNFTDIQETRNISHRVKYIKPHLPRMLKVIGKKNIANTKVFQAQVGNLNFKDTKYPSAKGSVEELEEILEKPRRKTQLFFKKRNPKAIKTFTSNRIIPNVKNRKFNKMIRDSKTNYKTKLTASNISRKLPRNVLHKNRKFFNANKRLSKNFELHPYHETNKIKHNKRFVPDQSLQLIYRRKENMPSGLQVYHEKKHHFENYPDLFPHSGTRVWYKSNQQDYLQSKINVNIPKTILKTGSRHEDTETLENQQIQPTMPALENPQLFKSAVTLPPPVKPPNLGKNQTGLNAATALQIKKLLYSLKQLLGNSKGKPQAMVKTENPKTQAEIAGEIENSNPKWQTIEITTKGPVEYITPGGQSIFQEKNDDLSSKLQTSKQFVAGKKFIHFPSFAKAHKTYQKIIDITVNKTVKTGPSQTSTVFNGVCGFFGLIFIIAVTIAIYIFALRVRTREGSNKFLQLFEPILHQESLPREGDEEFCDRIIEDNREFKSLMHGILDEMKFYSFDYLKKLYSEDHHQKKLYNWSKYDKTYPERVFL